MLRIAIAAAFLLTLSLDSNAKEEKHHHVKFSVRSVRDGKWSDPTTWQPARKPRAGDRVLVSRGTRVEFDVQEKAVIRLIQVVGVLNFSPDRSTEMNVGVLKVQNSDHCSESGFACDFHGVDGAGEPQVAAGEVLPSLFVGTPERPIAAEHTARIRLHFLEGMSKDDAPAIACCSARMELHGAPLSRTWVKLGANVKQGETRLTLSQAVKGWRVGDAVIVTASKRAGGSFRDNPDAGTERRTIVKVDGTSVTLDKPLNQEHLGEGRFRSEVANLSRNVIVESADPDGVRGHTVYHRFSKGSIRYARFAHLGKEGVLGRYSIHFHLVGDTMRGSSVVGAAIEDSHNRWLTIHGTQYLLVRDCVGYQSVGHGFFLEDGTEVYNLLDRNLGVQAYRGRRLPEQVLPFDPNDGAAFWWANGLNSLTRNVSCENDEYGYRYDMQSSRYFDSRLNIRQPDGEEKLVDVRTLPIWRFDGNEAHSEGLYGVVVAANGNRQPDTPIRDERSLARMKQIDWTGPDTKHPHTLRNLLIWNVHYGIRAQSPSMLLDKVHIHRSAYGIYRPAFENHVYRDLRISYVAAEPFNRGMDDASAQTGKLTVDGLIFDTGYGNSSTPLVQISDNNLSGDAETHFRRVQVNRPKQFGDRWPLINRGVGPRIAPVTKGVPIYLHDHFGEGRHAKVVSTAASDLLSADFKSSPPLTGNEARVSEVTDVAWPQLLDPQDDLPPATMITSVRRRKQGEFTVVGVSHDNGRIASIKVNGRPAEVVSRASGVVDWRITLPASKIKEISAVATDESGNVELTPHRVNVQK